MQARTESPTIKTERLSWRDSDREPFAAMCADPAVTEFFPSMLSGAQADAGINRQNIHISRYGFGFWALEDRSRGEFLGFTGLMHVGFTAAFTPAVEIGWRLAHRHWGKGYATEAAMASLDHGFGPLGLREIVSFTFTGNERSQRVMRRIGMRRQPAGDFDMPTLPCGHPLRRHALYRLRAEDRPPHSAPIQNEETLR